MSNKKSSATRSADRGRGSKDPDGGLALARSTNAAARRSRGLVAVLGSVLCLPLLATPALAAEAATLSPSALQENPCYATAISGSLQLDMNGAVNVGGPNFTSGVCKDINLKLTHAEWRTQAQACLEPSNGGPLNCSGWQVLPYDGEFHVLRYDVLGGTRWQLQMKSDSAQTVTFDYTA
jgi:hypothetical protein